jgi:glycosyltransferase involved in cell wall biosynthesis
LGSDVARPRLISVVITVRNEEQHLPALLDSLLAQEPPFEIVVVESESRDRTLAIAQEYQRRHPGVVHALPHPGSRGIGRNVGVRRARGEWVAFIDGDCFADSQWLKHLRRALGEVPVAAGQTVIVGRSRYGRLGRVELFQSGYDVTYPSCNLAYRRALFSELGGFDPRFITAEDIDLNLRAVRAGASIRYVPEAIVYHQARANFVRFLYQAFWNGYGRKQLTEKHGSLWGRYRHRRLISGQQGVVAWARLSAAMTGYFARVATGGGNRLGPGVDDERAGPEAELGSSAS